jgi:hypothetical protein
MPGTSEVVNSGTITAGVGTLTLGGADVPTNTGTLNIGTTGSIVQIAGGGDMQTFENEGTINLSGGTLTSAPATSNDDLENTGTSSGFGTISFVKGGISNAGTLTATGGDSQRQWLVNQ